MLRESLSLAQIGGDVCVHADLPGHHSNHPTETRPPVAQPIVMSLSSQGQWDSENVEVGTFATNQRESVGVFLAEGRLACAVAGALMGKGGACQSRIHSGGAIDLDSFYPGGEGGGGCCG